MLCIVFGNWYFLGTTFIEVPTTVVLSEIFPKFPWAFQQFFNMLLWVSSGIKCLFLLWQTATYRLQEWHFFISIVPVCWQFNGSSRHFHATLLWQPATLKGNRIIQWKNAIIMVLRDSMKEMVFPLPTVSSLILSLFYLISLALSRLLSLNKWTVYWTWTKLFRYYQCFLVSHIITAM